HGRVAGGGEARELGRGRGATSGLPLADGTAEVDTEVLDVEHRHGVGRGTAASPDGVKPGSLLAGEGQPAGCPWQTGPPKSIPRFLTSSIVMASDAARPRRRTGRSPGACSRARGNQRGAPGRRDRRSRSRGS